MEENKFLHAFKIAFCWEFFLFSTLQYLNNVILIEKSSFVILKFLIQMHWSIDQTILQNKWKDHYKKVHREHIDQIKSSIIL